MPYYFITETEDEENTEYIVEDRETEMART